MHVTSNNNMQPNVTAKEYQYLFIF